MKRRLMALSLAVMMSFSSFSMIYADDSENTDTETVTEDTTKEEETEKETEKETEESTTKEAESEATTKEVTTEKATEATTKATATEPTTSSTTTTTKKSSSSSSSSSNNKYTNEDKEYSITLSKDGSISLSIYTDNTGLDAEFFDWYSNSTSIATVSNKGVVNAVSTGSTTITATAIDGSVKYTYTFDVRVTTSTSATSKSFTIYLGDTKSLYSYVDDEYKKTDYTWTTDTSKVATVSSSGVVSAKKKGTATITASLDKGDVTKEYTFDITVKSNSSDDEDSNVRYSSSSSSSSSSTSVSAKTSWEFYLGKTDEVDVSDILEDEPDGYTWNISNDDVVYVDEESGVIEATDTGTTKVTAKGSRNYTFTIKVDKGYSIKTLSMSAGNSRSLEDDLTDDIGNYSYESDRKDVATVSSSGKVTAQAKGVATIICTNDDESTIEQFMILVSGSTKNTTTTTTEYTTEATTVQKEAATKATTSAVEFKDISHRAWAIHSIKQMASKGYIAGVGNNRFSPDANCKRADFTIVLTKILGIDGKEASSNYSDVAAGQYYYNYVGVARDNDIECGVNGDKFRPDDYITREEMMVMVYKGIEAVAGSTMSSDTSVLDKFTDAKDIAEENKAAVAALVNSGAISGTSDTTLEPKANITRAQMAVIMNKVDQTIN